MVKIFGVTFGRQEARQEPAETAIAEEVAAPQEKELPPPSQEITVIEKRPLPMAAWGGEYGGGYAPVIRTIYNGEKNFGELGPVIEHILDHDRLGRRAWQLDLDSETCHTIVKQKTRWVTGMGLMLQCQPQVAVLKAYGINIKAEEFNKPVEALWKAYSDKNTLADYAKRVSLHKIAKRVYKNGSVWGYVLCILRIGDQDNVTVQLIDGQHIGTPMGLSLVASTDKLIDNRLGLDYKAENGNIVRHGVEMDETGQHTAYYVRNGMGFTYTRVPARDRRGSLRAYLYTGEEYRLEDPLAIPLITPSMESAKQLETYTSATVGSAVERQRIAYFIEHELGSEGIDPRAENLAKIVGTNRELDLPRLASGEQIANTIAASTNKQTFNMGVGSKVSSPNSDQELYFKDFSTTISNNIAATADIPPEVANQMYGGSYSASRAATNGFQYSLNIDRADFGDQFYQPIYNLQMDIWVLTGKIQAPGYLDALRKNNQMVLSAYRYANWIGDPVPQIDELAEVKAARLKLGTAAAHLPLSTAERVTRNLGDGDYGANMLQLARELEEADKAKIPREDLLTENEGDEGGENDDKKKKKTTPN